MLIGFSVGNYRSFKDVVTLSMVAAEDACGNDELDKNNVFKVNQQFSWLFWFLCGNEVYTDSLFRQIALKVLPDKHFTIP